MRNPARDGTRGLRRAWPVLLLGVCAAWGGLAHAELVFEESAAGANAPEARYPHPGVPSIVFVSPEARELGTSWLPSTSPVILRPPVVLNTQQQQLQAPVAAATTRSLMAANSGTTVPNTVAANASLNMAHAYRFNLLDCAPGWALRFGIAFGSRSCSFNPYFPYVIAPQQPGFNRPADRLTNPANAARAVDQAHDYRFRR